MIKLQTTLNPDIINKPYYSICSMINSLKIIIIILCSFNISSAFSCHGYSSNHVCNLDRSIDKKVIIPLIPNWTDWYGFRLYIPHAGPLIDGKKKLITISSDSQQIFSVQVSKNNFFIKVGESKFTLPFLLSTWNDLIIHIGNDLPHKTYIEFWNNSIKYSRVTLPIKKKLIKHIAIHSNINRENSTYPERFYYGNFLYGGKYSEVNPMNKSFTSTIIVKNPIIVNGVFDGKGSRYIWQGKGDCSQKENMPPMFILQNKSTLKNLTMVNAPDGIHIRGSNVIIDNVSNYDVCEDAISIKGRQSNILISNNTFYHCADKGIQLSTTKNWGDNIQITSNKFVECRTPIRIVHECKQTTISDNLFLNFRYAIRITESQSINIQNNMFINGTYPLKSPKHLSLNQTNKVIYNE